MALWLYADSNKLSVPIQFSLLNISTVVERSALKFTTPWRVGGQVVGEAGSPDLQSVGFNLEGEPDIDRSSGSRTEGQGYVLLK
ncbi:hypothetical protein EVAR_10119_1 [Eumeta japonica]|uniref:Uncharacterized protein n=1 Tax=Eumeta variegata TaxID=151549 RepID=A0A4C1UCB7_EUMVA|nr:hypothetical protein EVAR_10119_1 [Eumeta japonica]